MQNFPDTLGDVLKEARIRSGTTVDAVAEYAGITTRYLYRIENEHQKPGYRVLCRLIRFVSAPVEPIFYPDKHDNDPELEEIIHMLHRCDKRSLKVVRATLQAVLEDQLPNNEEKGAEPTTIE